MTDAAQSPETTISPLNFLVLSLNHEEPLTGNPVRFFVRFLPAIGDARLKELKRKVKQLPIFKAMFATIDDLARELNPLVRGLLNYYGRFYPSKLKRLKQYLNERIMIWIRKKYNRSSKGGTTAKAIRFLKQIYKTRPKLFVHWADGLSMF